MSRDTYKYELRDGNRVVYVGITNDLQRRESERPRRVYNYRLYGS